MIVPSNSIDQKIKNKKNNNNNNISKQIMNSKCGTTQYRKLSKKAQARVQRGKN